MKPEFLLVDLGNTRVKWAVAGAQGPIHVLGERPTGEVDVAWIRELARSHPQHQLVLASVVPSRLPAFERLFARRCHVVSGRMCLAGLAFDYPKPGELGADRIAAAVAAHAEGKFPAIIVACGTATAFTVLDAGGRLCGGAIAPGLQAQLDALIGATAQLPAVELEMPRRALAKSTGDAIRAGVVLNFQGGIREIVRRLGEALPPGTEPQILLTGGNAGFVARELGPRVVLRPLLVLEGLRIIGTRLEGAPADA